MLDMSNSITRDELIEKLKAKGVKWEETRKPFDDSNEQPVSLIGTYDKEIII